MKRFFRTLFFVAVATVATVSISSCCKEDDEDKNNKKDVFILDPNRESGGKVDQMSGASSDAFYKGLTNNAPETTIVIDTRSAKEYKAGHVVRAISIPLENDDAFYYDDEFIYKEVERLDPDHSKFILLTDNGASTLMLHVAGRISAMGWGKQKVYLLMDKTADFLKKYSDVKE
ncbi:MAG: rhodanese-like domain-containing protein [Paludibacteraceae bacterium]|nr:rhodanese-like domain-containing protein [Paludibacteraceae bacterium]